MQDLIRRIYADRDAAAREAARRDDGVHARALARANDLQSHMLVKKADSHISVSKCIYWLVCLRVHLGL